MPMLQNIINDLKNQDIEVDDAQLDLIKSIVDIQTKKKTVLDSLKGKIVKNSFYTWGAVGRGKTLLSEAILKNIGNGKSSISFHYIDYRQPIKSSSQEWVAVISNIKCTSR